MYLILFWLLCALVTTCEKIAYLFSCHQQPEVLLATVLKQMSSKNLSSSIEVAVRAKSPMGRIFSAALKRLPCKAEEFQAVLDQAALEELPRIGKRIPLLALYANLAMLCGLFGTIVGLIKAFDSVGGPTLAATDKARVLAEGISEAMNCTAFGLISAILALISFSFLSNWVQTLEDDIHARTVQLYNYVIEDTSV